MFDASNKDWRVHRIRPGIGVNRFDYLDGSRFGPEYLLSTIDDNRSNKISTLFYFWLDVFLSHLSPFLELIPVITQNPHRSRVFLFQKQYAAFIKQRHSRYLNTGQFAVDMRYHNLYIIVQINVYLETIYFIN
jgi:hypothetical protein